MLGFRLNKLGAAMRNGLDLRSLYGGESYGFLPYLNSADHNRQTYNAPATTAASAGDPVGLWMPQAPGNASVTNLLLWTDAFDNAAWVKPNSDTVTANVANNSATVPTADVFVETAATSAHTLYQDVTITDGSVYTVQFEFKPAGRSILKIRLVDSSDANGVVAEFDVTNGTIATAAAVIGTGGSAAASITSKGNGWYLCSVTGSLGSGITTARIRIRPLAVAGGSESIVGLNAASYYIARAQLNLGSTALDYQPNAGSLGGSNRRTGGSNMLLWTEEQDNTNAACWSLTDITVTRGSVTGPTGRQNGNLVTEGSAGTAIGSQAFAILAGSTVTISYYMKRGGAGAVQWNKIQINSSGGTTRFWFDLQNGVAGSHNASAGTHTYVASSITADSNGYYRVQLSVTVATDTSISTNFCSASADSSNTRVNNATYYLTQAMVNLGSSADTYSRNMDQLGGLLQSAVLFQSTSADRGTRARRPANGIRNLLLNNMMTGGSAPSTYPTGWSEISSALGTITATLAYGTDSNGNPCLDVALVGTSSGTGYYGGYFATATTVNAVSGNTVTNSVEMKLQAGALTNVGVRLGIDEQTSAGAYVTGGNNAVTPTSTQTRLSYTRTLSGGGTVAYARPSWLVSWAGAVAVNITLRFVLPQCEKAAAATAIQKVTSVADITESGYPDVWHTLWDGTSDYGTFGVQSFGTASLFAAAGQAWTVWGVFRATSTAANQTILAKAAASPRDLHLFLAATTNVLTANIREAGATSAYAFTDGAFHVWALRWDGSTARLWTDKNASESVAVGTSAETAQNILVSARTESSPAAFFNGHNDVATVDRALSDAEVAQLMSNLNATYRAGL